jgi:DNA-binding response OmpR family regulator
MSGFDVLRAMRGTSKIPPILIITARDRVEDMVTGLDLGADDSIVKPFELRALLARIRAIVRADQRSIQFLGDE